MDSESKWHQMGHTLVKNIVNASWKLYLKFVQNRNDSTTTYNAIPTQLDDGSALSLYYIVYSKFMIFIMSSAFKSVLGKVLKCIP